MVTARSRGYRRIPLKGAELMIRTIFVPLAEGLSSQPLLDAALLVARRTKSHIRAIFIRPEPETALAYMPDVIIAAGATREAIERASREVAAAEKARFEAWQAVNNLPGVEGVRLDSCFATWADRVGEIETEVARFGRVSDLIVLQRVAPGRIMALRCFDAAVFESGRPALLVTEKLPFDIVDHVMIAWNGSLEASRAVLGAMPLLHLANRVSIFAAPQYDAESVDPDDLAEALSWHGIRAHMIASPGSESSTGEALVDAATRQRATLIVMGAYTHSRLRQRFLGGVTEHLLAHAPVPLLMTH
jgi:nucleotide-binding universal stress UspA family protein